MSDAILVVAAMPSELPRRLPELGAQGLVVGSGACDLDGELPGHGPVLVTGTCGALTEAHGPGTLVLASWVSDGRGRLVPDAAWRARLAEAARAAGLDAATEDGLVEASGVVDGARERTELAGRSGAAFADLETARIARLCARAERPWAVLRVVTDAPGSELGWLGERLGGMPVQEPSLAQVVRGLARRPSALPKLVALGRLVSRGRRDVREVIARLRCTIPNRAT